MKNPFHTSYNDRDDIELITSAKDGSKSALEALVKKHQHYIYNVALKMTLSPFDAEDITQEVLIKVITNLANFKGESNFRTWLYRITELIFNSCDFAFDCTINRSYFYFISAGAEPESGFRTYAQFR